MAKRVTEEEVARDEFAEGVHSAVVYAQQNWIKIIIVVLLLLVGLLVWESMRARRERLAAGSNLEITTALTQLATVEGITDPELRANEAQRLVEGLDKFLITYPDQKLTNEGNFLKGKTLFAVDRFAEAQASYQTYIANAAGNEERARGELAMAYSVENQAFLTTDTTEQRDLLRAALAGYERAVQLAPDSYLAAYATMGQARVNELQGNNAQAIALYEKVVQTRPSPMMTEVETPEDTTPATGQAAEMTRMLRRQIQRMESQIAFEKTAQLRLASLRGSTETLTAPAGTPAAAATPAP